MLPTFRFLIVFIGPPSPPPPPPAYCVSAGKAWFFADDVTVALGTDIDRGGECADLPLTTSLQQSNLLGSDVYVGGDGPTEPIRLGANSTMSCTPSQLGCAWVWHAGLLYIIVPTPTPSALGSPASPPSPSPPSAPVLLSVSNRVKTGTEFAITQGDNATIVGEVFAAHLSHGDGPGRSYGYAVTPCPNVSQAQAVLRSLSITVLSNQKPVQALCSNSGGDGLRGLQAVLWPTDAGVTVDGAAAGCWNISVAASPALSHGLLVQIRVDSNGTGAGAAAGAGAASPGAATAYVISAVMPAVKWSGAAPTDVATVWIAGVRLRGDGCQCQDGSGLDRDRLSGGSPIGTTVTVALDGAGATNAVRCVET